ncbi:hypothetical protein MTO96_034408 [Rhipicephalus appendiculatus]
MPVETSTPMSPEGRKLEQVQGPCMQAKRKKKKKKHRPFLRPQAREKRIFFEYGSWDRRMPASHLYRFNNRAVPFFGAPNHPQCSFRIVMDARNAV